MSESIQTPTDAEVEKLAAMIEPPAEIAGVKLRSFSAASLILLTKTENPLMKHHAKNEDGSYPEIPDLFFHIAAFIFIHAAPMTQVSAASKTADLFREKVLEYAQTLSIKNMMTAGEEIHKIIAQATVGLDFQVENDTADPNA